MGDNFMKKILLILIAAFVLQFFVFGEEDSYEETFEQNETADMKDSFSQDDVLGLDGIFWEKPKSQFRLGSLYYNGDVVERNLEKAKYWFEKSAEQGDSDAQVRLGSMYLFGEGVKQDLEKARYWIEKSVEQGNSHAQCNLGLLYWLYYEEEKVDQDMEKAEYWLEKSAEQGDRDAQYYLGEFHYYGDPVERERAIIYKRYYI